MLEHHYAISDLHLGHSNVLKPEYDNRPFATIEEHDAAITANVIAVGGPTKTLWLLGDIARTKEQLEAFMTAIRPHWGKINLIRGNHDDKVAWKYRELFDEAHEARYVRLSKQHRFYLHHYACRVWRNSHHAAYHIHGHSHGALPPLGRSIDVSANCVGYKPPSFAEIVERLHNAPFLDHHADMVAELSGRLTRLRSYLRGVMVDRYGESTPEWESARNLLNGFDERGQAIPKNQPHGSQPEHETVSGEAG